jgi:hypothetical protein
MKINKNKSFELSLIVATDDKNIIDNIFDEKELNNLNLFYNITKYKNDKYNGYKLLWKTSNIDKISTSSSDVVYDLGSIRESVPSKVFRVRKGLFSNTYQANFIFDPSNYNIVDNAEGKNDLVFSVDFDKKCIDNNADTIKNKGKRLIWNLKEDEISEIKFSFSLYNYGYIFFLVLFGIISFILMVYSTKKILQKRV